jgi:hypothetical protein
LAPVVQTNNANLTSPHSSVVTPKQSNRLVDKIHVIKSIPNPYKHQGNTRPDTNISYMSSNLTKSSSVSASSMDCNTVSPLSECLNVVAPSYNNRPLISPPTQSSILTIAQKRRIASNKARALAIRAKSTTYATPLKTKEAASLTEKKREDDNDSSARKSATVGRAKSALMSTKLNCGICSSIVNPYIIDRTKIANGDPICANCLSNLTFSQDSVVSVNI